MLLNPNLLRCKFFLQRGHRGSVYVCNVYAADPLVFFFSSAPFQETCEGKVTQLYSGFGYEQIIKMAWTSLLLQPMVIWRPWLVQLRFFTQERIAEREQPRVHQKVWRKVTPIHPKKTDLDGETLTRATRSDAKGELIRSYIKETNYVLTRGAQWVA